MATLKDELAEILRREIEAGVYPPGSMLPAERVLATAKGVSRITAQGALRKLVGWGMVTARHGIGYEVRSGDRLVWVASDSERGGDLDEAPNDSWSRQIRRQGRRPSEKIVSVEHVAATAEQAVRLAVRRGATLVARRRLRFVDDQPRMIADSFYPYSIVKNTPIDRPHDVQPGVFAIFERMGRPWSGHRRDLAIARMPTPEEADLLGMAEGEAVLQLSRVSRDRAGVPVRLAVFTSRDSMEFDYQEE